MYLCTRNIYYAHTGGMRHHTQHHAWSRSSFD